MLQLPLKSLSFNYLTTRNRESGLSCLQSACIEGDIGTVSTILNLSPDKLDSAIALSVKIGQNSSRYPGKSVLFVLRQQESEIHKQILEIAEKISQYFQSGLLLHLAAEKGNVEHLCRLLDLSEHVDSVCPGQSEDEKTPLMCAAEFNGVDVVEFLIERGASLETQDKRGLTPFLHAVIGSKMRNIKRLMELGANIFKTTNRRISAVHLAARNGDTEVVRLLLQHDVNANQGAIYGFNPLMLAAGKGCLDSVTLLLDNGADSNSCDDLGQTPLHFAARRGVTDVVKCLLQHNANLFAKTRNGETVLHLAASTCLELVIFFVDQGADIHAKGTKGRTPLHVAAANGQSDTVNFFLTCGVNINSRDVSGCTALSYAIQESHMTAKILIERECEVKLRDLGGNCVDDGILESAAYKGFKDILKLLHDRGVPLDAVNRSGKTPLMTAAEAGKCDVMAFLLDQGANINGLDSVNVKEVKASRTDHNESDCKKEDERNSDLNRTPLSCAFEAGQGEAAKLLIERGCLSSNSDGETNSLAELAAMHGLTDVFELLADKKSFPFDKIKDGETLLTSAAHRGDFDSVKFLLQNGANVNAKNSLGDTALSCAVQFLGSSSTEIVKLLLESGADMNTRNERCETPLLLATKRNAEKVVALLLELRCETNVSNVCSLSPLHYAAENNNGRVTEKLLQYGVDPSVKEDDEGMTPLHVATNTGSVLAAEVLLEHGVDTEVRTNLGETPLVIAARRGNVSIGMVQFLLQKGSNVHAKDTSGMTPLTNAVIDYRGVKSFSLVKKLLNLGSCVNDIDNFGGSALHYIPSNAERQLFDLLLHVLWR